MRRRDARHADAARWPAGPDAAWRCRHPPGRHAGWKRAAAGDDVGATQGTSNETVSDKAALRLEVPWGSGARYMKGGRLSKGFLGRRWGFDSNMSLICNG